MQASMEHIRERYGVERKDAEELQKKAGKMAGAMAAFCERMGHRDLALLISRFQVSCVHVSLRCAYIISSTFHLDCSETREMHWLLPLYSSAR